MIRLMFLLAVIIAAERLVGPVLAISMITIVTIVAVCRWIVWRSQRRSELAQERYMEVAVGQRDAESGILTEIWSL